MLARIPLNGFLKLAEATAMVFWLNSEDGVFSTGTAFDISGGCATY